MRRDGGKKPLGSLACATRILCRDLFYAELLNSTIILCRLCGGQKKPRHKGSEMLRRRATSQQEEGKNRGDDGGVESKMSHTKGGNDDPLSSLGRKAIGLNLRQKNYTSSHLSLTVVYALCKTTAKQRGRLQAVVASYRSAGTQGKPVRTQRFSYNRTHEEIERQA